MLYDHKIDITGSESGSFNFDYYIFVHLQVAQTLPFWNVFQYHGETISILNTVGQWFGTSEKSNGFPWMRKQSQESIWFPILAEWTCMHLEEMSDRFEASRSASYCASFQ